MTTPVLSRADCGARVSRTRQFVMCPPTWFEVAYVINPWMDAATPVDASRALRQWSDLVAAYRAAGHQVQVLDPVRGLPDMVYAANGATVVDGRVLGARFAHPQRAAEAAAHTAWHRAAGREVVAPVAVNEAEGDFAVLADRVLAGWGFRTTRAAHAELAAVTGREVVSLELIDPRFYHLDVALGVLDDVRGHIAYYPDAFSAASRTRLAELYPDAVLATAADAYAFGLNCVSDGLNVFLPAGAARLRSALTAAGYRPVEVDLSELHRGGGSVKCCTQEIRPQEETA